MLLEHFGVAIQELNGQLVDYYTKAEMYMRQHKVRVTVLTMLTADGRSGSPRGEACAVPPPSRPREGGATY